MDNEIKLKGLSGFILRLFGWKIFRHYPPNPGKVIYVVGPHTSNWDFLLGLLVRRATKFKAQFIGKHTLFFFPLGIWMRWLGGIPLNRKKSKNFVDYVVHLYNTGKAEAIGIAPEGTRKKVDRLKSGYYHIARKAGVPIILVLFDYGNKRVVFNKPFHTTDNAEKDMEYIESEIKAVRGKNLENSF